MGTVEGARLRKARLIGCSLKEVIDREGRGERWCNRCHQWKSWADFHKGKSWCRQCVGDHNSTVRSQRAATQGRYAANHPDRIKHRNDRYRASSTKVADYMRAYSLRELYGLTVAEYDELLAAQGGGCAICGRTKSDSSGRRLCVDHCHETGRVRGLLCRRCNLLVGAFEKDLDRMRAGIAYLQRALADREHEGRLVLCLEH